MVRNPLIKNIFLEGLEKDLQALLFFEAAEASSYVDALDDHELYMVSAALEFLQGAKEIGAADIGERAKQIQVLCTMFVFEAIEDIFEVDGANANEKLSSLITKFLNREEKTGLLLSFTFSELSEQPSAKDEPIFHLMRPSVQNDIDFLRRHVLGLLDPLMLPRAERQDAINYEQDRIVGLFEPQDKPDPLSGEMYVDYKECTAPCDCEAWINKQPIEVIDALIPRFAEKLYHLRNSMTHHGFPQNFAGNEGWWYSRAVWRTDNGLRAMSYGVRISMDELKLTLRTCLGRFLKNQGNGS